jgi:hypothetical protein
MMMRIIETLLLKRQAGRLDLPQENDFSIRITQPESQPG